MRLSGWASRAFVTWRRSNNAGYSPPRSARNPRNRTELIYRAVSLAEAVRLQARQDLRLRRKKKLFS